MVEILACIALLSYVGAWLLSSIEFTTLSLRICYNGHLLQQEIIVRLIVEIALYIALIILGSVLTFLVVLQGRNAGMQTRNTSSIYRTKRGLEKTIHQATIVIGVVFLVLSLIASLPLFPSTPAAGLLGL